MIKTTIVGLGKIGFYDANNRNERLTHYISVIRTKILPLCLLWKKKFYNSFKKV